MIAVSSPPSPQDLLPRAPADVHVLFDPRFFDPRFFDVSGDIPTQYHSFRQDVLVVPRARADAWVAPEEQAA